MEFFRELSVADLFIVVALALGVFAGFTQGLIRYALNVVVVLVAFVFSSLLAGPLDDALSFWDAFPPELRLQIFYLLLYVGAVVGGWFVVRALYQRTRLPIPRQLDELGGALLGLLYTALFLGFLTVVMDTFFLEAPDVVVAQAGFIRALYDALGSSSLITLIRETLIPVFGFVVGPLVPDDVAQYLEPEPA